MIIQKDWEADVVITAGTPHASPSVPSTPAGYIKIAEVLVTAVTGIASSGDVTDTRSSMPSMSYSKTVATKSANYTAVASDALIQVSGTNDQTLPDATQCSGLEYVYVKTDSGTTTTFLTQSGQTMSGVASGGLTLTEQWEWKRFRSNGTNWLVVG
jgi:hypothetical protein